METKNEYSIEISGINSECVHYFVYKNEQDFYLDEFTIKELKLFQKELLDFYEILKDCIIEMLKNQIKYLEDL